MSKRKRILAAGLACFVAGLSARLIVVLGDVPAGSGMRLALSLTHLVALFGMAVCIALWWRGAQGERK